MKVVPLGTCSSSIIMSAMDKEKQPLRCPRCDSTNTKFCYYNNHSLSQPRHFCKSCKRYWTRGGTLRNIPIGGGCRKNKRIKQFSSRPLATNFQETSMGSTGAVYQHSIDQKYSTEAHSPYMNGSLQQHPSSCVTPSYALEPPHEFRGLGLGLLSSNKAPNNDGTSVYKDDYNMLSSSRQMIHNLSKYYTNTFGSSSYSSPNAVTLSTISTLLSSRPQSIPQQQTSAGADGRTKGLLGGMFLKEMKLQNGQCCWELDESRNKGEIETLVDSSPSAQCLSWNGTSIGSWLGPYNGIGTSSSSSVS